MLTRQQQLAAKKAEKTEENPEGPLVKRPSGRGRVPKAKAKGGAKAKAKASASPKKRATPKKRVRSKQGEKKVKGDEEEEAPKDDDKDGDGIKTPKRKLFQSDEEGKEDEKPGATM